MASVSSNSNVRKIKVLKRNVEVQRTCFDESENKFHLKAILKLLMLAHIQIHIDALCTYLFRIYDT